ncbi:nucleoside monophosphate kinase [Patescibacteria group bacterium]|nr:nucleoside monophosphate kinase [Patescibacteria group bacterium]MBU1683474.1 nucleoside monophosphate kinase [Patescibacteria group bacterium]MBU1935583.1 nucleoside monophosphate kinase [Patescibacteria group bacterium]
MDIVLFGMQGSGKGTQGKILAEMYGLKVFDMGAELRGMIESGTELGVKIKDIVERGDLVDDDTIMEVIENFLKSISSDQSVVFDGIPRTMNQAEKLLSLLKSHGRKVFGLHVKISEKEAISRLTQRRVCSNCKEVYPAFYKNDDCAKCHGALITRQDDSNLDAITKRLENYQRETESVIQHFYGVDRLIEVDGEQPIPDVTEEMVDKAGYLFS